MLRPSIQSINYTLSTIAHNAALFSSTLSNYDYLLQLSMDLRTLWSQRGYIPAETQVRTAHVVQSAVLAIIPIVPLVDFDSAGEGEDLDYIVNIAVGICVACDDDGLAQGLVDKYIKFQIMCEGQERLDEQWLTDHIND
jgi:hypothetical protein